MGFAVVPPYIGASGEWQIFIFILFALIWIVGGLLKKASEASRRSTSEGTRPRTRPGGGPETTPRIPSLSDFLKRIQEMSEEVEKPAPPPKLEVSPPTPKRVLVMPPSPRRPTMPRKPGARPSVVRQPSLKRIETRQEPRKPEPPVVPEVWVEKPPEPREFVPKVVPSTAPEAPRLDAYAMKAPEERRIEQVLGERVSVPAFRRGIILAEILGQPKALRGRRRPVPRR